MKKLKRKKIEPSAPPRKPVGCGFLPHCRKAFLITASYQLFSVAVNAADGEHSAGGVPLSHQPELGSGGPMLLADFFKPCGRCDIVCTSCMDCKGGCSGGCMSCMGSMGSQTTQADQNHAEANRLNDAGLAAKQAGRLDEAINLYQQALKLEPDNEVYNWNISIAVNDKGVEIENNGNLKKAVEWYKSAMAFDSRNKTAADNYKRASKLYKEQQEQQRRRDEAVRLNDKGVDLYNAGNYKKAEKLFAQAVETDPENKEARKNLSMSLNNQGVDFIHAGETNTALAYYRRALEVNPANSNARKNLSFSIANQGLDFEKAWQLEKAAERYREALQSLPNEESLRQQLDRVETKLRKKAQQSTDLAESLTETRQILDKGLDALSTAGSGEPLFSKGTKDSAPVVTGLSFDDVTAPQSESAASQNSNAGISVPSDLRDAVAGKAGGEGQLTPYSPGSRIYQGTPENRAHASQRDRPAEELSSATESGKGAKDNPNTESSASQSGLAFDNAAPPGKEKLGLSQTGGKAATTARSLKIADIEKRIEELKKESGPEAQTEIIKLLDEKQTLVNQQQYEEALIRLGVTRDQVQPQPKPKVVVPVPGRQGGAPQPKDGPQPPKEDKKEKPTEKPGVQPPKKDKTDEDDGDQLPELTKERADQIILDNKAAPGAPSAARKGARQ